MKAKVNCKTSRMLTLVNNAKMLFLIIKWTKWIEVSGWYVVCRPSTGADPCQLWQASTPGTQTSELDK